MVRLSAIVETSQKLKATRSRSAKVAAVADLMKDREPDAVRTIAAWMSGQLLQGRIGISIGRAYEFSRGVEPADSASLTVKDVDRAFEELKDAGGPGSLGQRERTLERLLSAATADEQTFLVGLLSGELRQGALAGIVTEAIAKATGISSTLVRRAAMLSGELPHVAATAFAGGKEALAQIELHLFVPVLPMLAQTADTAAEALAKKSPLAFEEKLDGIRLQLHREGDRVEIYSRSLRRLTPSLPEIVAYAKSLPVDRIILDGEIVRFDVDGRPHGFGAAMERLGRSTEAPEVEPETFADVTPVFFDCLMADGEPLIDRPTEERWAALEKAVGPDRRVRRCVTADADEASAFLHDVLARGHEGVVAKSLASTYSAGGRGAHWFKIKPAHTLDVVVLGAEWGSGRRKGSLSNLHLGVLNEDTGQYVMLGKTFKGMTDEMLAWQTERLLGLETHRDRYTVYVRPELVVEVAFAELMTSRRYDSKLAFRFARVLRYRTDKPVDQADTLAAARAIKKGTIRARVGAAKKPAAPRPAVQVTHGDRVLFPGVGLTKKDVVDYYFAVADRMLVHLRDRPLTLVRHPKGIGDKGFFQKNVAPHYPEDLIRRIEMPRKDGVTVHPSVSSAEGLAYLANQGTIEFHVPLGTRDHVWKPDRLVFDFDPPENGAAEARRAAWACKALLDELGVESTPMATGGKGYHVSVRLEPTASMMGAAHKLGAILVDRHPNLLTHEFKKDLRRGRVLVDWMRNAGLATVVAPWSLRARPGAPVATPLTWDELDRSEPDGFTIRDAVERHDALLDLEPVDPHPIIEAADRMIESSGIELEFVDRFGRHH